MRVHKIALLAAWVTASCGATARAADLIVVCHAGVSLTVDDVKDLYYGDKTSAGSVKLQPVDNGAAEAAFLDKVLKIDVKTYKNAWIKKAFRDGVTPPAVKASDAEALAFVKATAGACSYVTSAPGDGTVVVAKF